MNVKVEAGEIYDAADVEDVMAEADIAYKLSRDEFRRGVLAMTRSH